MASQQGEILSKLNPSEVRFFAKSSAVMVRSRRRQSAHVGEITLDVVLVSDSYE